MRTVYDPKFKANLTLDEDRRVRGITYVDEYREVQGHRGRDAAVTYIRDVAQGLAIEREALQSLEQRVSYLDPRLQGVEYRFSEEKGFFDSATYAFYQTYLNTPVWTAGITVTVKQAPARVLAATDTSERGIDAELPSARTLSRYRLLFATGEKVEGQRREAAARRPDQPEAAAADLLEEILSGVEPAARDLDNRLSTATLIRGRFFVYRYDPAERTSDQSHGPSDMPLSHRDEDHAFDEPLCGTPPTLPLPPVPRTIQEGRWYVVAELVFRMPYEGHRMNWRMLVELETNAILYLRALASGVNGQVFTYDPITSTGDTTNTPDRSSMDLNPRRANVELLNLDPPAGTPSVQSLRGTWAALTEIETPSTASPTQPAGADFDYEVRTNEFAAVNAYYHTDRFFRLVEDLGFPLTGATGYFNGTSFPVEVDHRGRGNSINAHCIGDGDGIDHVCYALAHDGDTTNPIGISTDWRVHLHELAGHGILYDHVGVSNFGFAHSAGDSFAMILNDYESAWHSGAPLDRFLLVPFAPSIVRRSDRTVAAGWGWGGTSDLGGYLSEQILSTTMFRAYRSIGGDSASASRREFAARCMAYLMLRAVGTLTPMSNPSSPAQLLTALLAADAGDWTSEGVSGGAYGKVITWAFETQNLNGGAPPAVDVYIDDGRAGEYGYLPVHWATTAIWNRRTLEAVPGTDHEEPALGETNYAYVRIKNRGTSVASNVVVRGYHCKPTAGVRWEVDLQPCTTASLSAGTLQPNDTQEKIVGPFHWTPVVNAWGHDCMLMIVSATGDPSNVENFAAGEVIEDWRLVPNDNNVAQRNVVFAPGGGGVPGLMAGLDGKGFWVGNPGRSSAAVVVSVVLPPLLATRGWRIDLRGIPADGVRLKPREQRLVTFAVRAGAPFTQADVRAAGERDIVVTATADGAIVGGMVYRVDPDLDRPYNDHRPGPRCRDLFWQLLVCMWRRLRSLLGLGAHVI